MLDEEFFTKQLWLLDVQTYKTFLPDAATGTTASTFLPVSPSQEELQNLVSPIVPCDAY